MRQTSTVDAPWLIVEGEDEGYRSVTVATTIRDAINKALAENRGVRPSKPSAPAPSGKSTKASGGKAAADKKEQGESTAIATILSNLDMTQTVSKRSFGTELEKQQGRLNQLQRRAHERRLDDPRVRRLGRRGQGRRDPSAHRRARRAATIR